MPPSVRQIQPLTWPEIAPLVDASEAEGYPFVRKLWNEYEAGVARFDDDGAALFGVYDASNQLVAIGGIHRDPYLSQPDIARVRHVYVMPEMRGAGVGRLLMDALIGHARTGFAYLTLRTPTAHGDAFYTALGFSRAPRFENATHWLALKRGS